MKATFADSSYYVAIANPRDAWHRSAIEASGQVSGLTVTTEFILLEVANFLSRAATRHVFVDLLSILRAAPDVQILPASAELFAAGEQLFEQRTDKEWSLTDCSSFATMRRLQITDALTTDHHFEQAGFTRLIRDPD